MSTTIFESADSKTKVGATGGNERRKDEENFTSATQLSSFPVHFASATWTLFPYTNCSILELENSSTVLPRYIAQFPLQLDGCYEMGPIASSSDRAAKNISCVCL